MYTMKDLETITKKSSVSIRNLMKKNDEFRNITEANIIKSGRLVNYQKPVLQWLLNYYNIEKLSLSQDSVGIENRENTIPVETIQTPPLSAETQSRIDKLETALQSITEERNQLNNTINNKEDLISKQQKKIEELEARVTELIAQNGAVLLLLQEEKQEKQQLLLNPPRKSLIERIKNAFKPSTKEK